MGLDPLVSGPDRGIAVRAMFDRIAPRYDLVNRLMTFGLDVRWRRRAVQSLGLPSASLVLDVACGTGDLCRDLHRAGYRAIGVDVSAGMLGAAHEGVPLVQGDGLALPLPDAVADGITCGFALRNVVDIGALFGEFARVLRPGGRLAILEIAEPRSRALRSAHGFYFRRVVPLIGGLVSDRAAYRYLPASARLLPASEDLATLLAGRSCTDVRVDSVALGAVQLVTGTRDH